MSRDTYIQIAAAAVLSLCVLVSGVLGVQIGASAGRHKLTYADTTTEDAPPQVAMGIAMGAFRGLFVNMLWMRANALKEAGKFHEAMQLADAITTLQPRFPRVWVFHAWNMAYNISVSTQTERERWEWVNAGIRLLRDRGIPANPHDMLLPKELAWIFLHKIQGYTDDANPHYKRALAAEWQTILGPPPVVQKISTTRAQAIQAYVDWLKPITEAPATFDALYAAEPNTQRLVDELKAQVEDEFSLRLLQRHELMRAARSSGRWSVVRQAMGPKSDAFIRLRDDPALTKAWDALLAFVRRRVLEDQYHMEPARMLRYTQKYGPMDWRHPASHAVYWGARGVDDALERITVANRSEYDVINSDRITIQAVQELYRTGDLYFNYFDWMTQGVTFYLAVTDPHFADTYDLVINEVIDRSWADRRDRAFSLYAAGYENFYSDVVRFFYRRGQLELAEHYYKMVREYKGQNTNDPERAVKFGQPLREFIDQELNDRFSTPYVAVSEIAGALQGAFAQGLLGGDDELFRGQFEYAKRVHRWFMEQQRKKTNVDPNLSRMDVLDPDFRLVAGGFFAQFCTFLTLDDAERLYNNAPNDLKLFAYDVLKDMYKEVVDADTQHGGRPFNQVFPEPQGIEEHRRQMDLLQKAKSQRSLDVAPQ